MKFAHIADAHLGGWREPALREANAQSFITCIDKIIEQRVDFLLIAGDLFNTSVPPIDALKLAVQKLNDLKRAGIPVYLIPGSHDASPSGKTMLDVLEEAGLFINVVKGEVIDGKLRLKFTVDPKTGAKLTGLLGKKGGLDKHYYADLDRTHLENETGFKIFMFHCALTECKPKELQDMDALSISLFPKGFDYYAGGHVHVIDRVSIGNYKNVIYPGPVFPNNFAEIEKLKQGTFVLYNDGIITHVPIALHPVIPIVIDANGRTTTEVEELLRQQPVSVSNAIVTVRVSGTLSQGKPSDIQFQTLLQQTLDHGAYAILRNTSSLTSKEFEAITVDQNSVEDVEAALIREHSGKVFGEQEATLINTLMQALQTERNEGEKVSDFEKRITGDALQALARIPSSATPASGSNEQSVLDKMPS